MVAAELTVELEAGLSMGGSTIGSLTVVTGEEDSDMAL
jgi:hypothetical protein